MVKEKHYDDSHPTLEEIEAKLFQGGYDSDIRSTVKYLLKVIENQEHRIQFLEKELHLEVHGRIDDH